MEFDAPMVSGTSVRTGNSRKGGLGGRRATNQESSAQASSLAEVFKQKNKELVDRSEALKEKMQRSKDSRGGKTKKELYELRKQMLKKRVHKEPPSEDAGPPEPEVSRSMPQETKDNQKVISG